ncbi:bicyclomycin/multidrug efflux system [Clavibacter michiganensis]|uniref:Bicyclomycin/multidrug efflux system n=1 Tax=Clavibacter michiganensis TaxID=28447 RepID=A0A251XPH5_9MICO|nr:bicyclomycin/multidrug efflux system [Clavibacter michiganensis]
MLFRRIAQLYRESPRVLVFLLASAVFRDGLAAVFTFGAIIAAQVFGFTTTEVLLFGVAANVVAGIGTFAAGWFDDRFGAKPVILVSLACLVVGGSAVLAVGDVKAGFWATGLFLCLFVGPVQSSSRTFLARISPRAARERCSASTRPPDARSRSSRPASSASRSPSPATRASGSSAS